ncbi:DUF707 domain-containing protein [Pedobacter sp. SG908]|uniref:DUF707 domain-containing protein n=1 Tax=Pedobacter sp. SG908 TaxID=2587135 RepID=UPI00141E7663|nr:DUF707 domain-containing protein [Pedobacter sp. SG908]
MKKNCIIAAVGRGSLHKTWLHEEHPNIDIHLIVYDDSFEDFQFDTPFIQQAYGSKFKLINDYLTDELIAKYEYFYLPDDDVLIDHANIDLLFQCMKEFRLSAAQPAICNEFYSFGHTFKRENSVIRFTNFVEIMQPCFSREALKKVQFTFSETLSGWGIDYHWGVILDFKKYNMAILDIVDSEHTRPVRSNYQAELDNYLLKYNLKKDIYST